jgi:hypothetical protein
MIRTVIVIGILVVSANTAGAQTGNASVGGFVQDSSRAFIPGVTVTATNTQTGVSAEIITNESGTYNIPSLLPGVYTLRAELPGFRPHIFNEVRLGTNASARYNFTLEVGQLTDSVEVTAEATQLLAETSPTIGQVLPQQQVRDLPLVSTNVLDLMKTMAGVRGTGLGTATTFAGISTGMVNTVRDGLSVQEGRYDNGVGSTTVINPDMVGEFRVILTPVDAELGRGNGQVQILTRSGTNEFRGSAVWNVRNSALDANTWRNNKQVVRGVWTPGRPTWINRNQYTASLGGPIIRNKTFFFMLWEQQFERQRNTHRPIVLTDCARNGIFRYWEGWANGNINTLTSTAGANPTIASVDSSGNPMQPATNANGTPYSGQLRYLSVFGPLANTPTRPDCSDAVIQGSPWDSNRPGMDPAGMTQKYLSLMPAANVFDGGDGLNTAVHQWVRSGHNAGNFSIAGGTNTDADRRQINTKIDHNFNASHKVAFNYSYEWLESDYIPIANPTTQWPNGYESPIKRRPKVMTVNYTSTLTPSLLNEARFGYRANWHYIWAPWETPDPKANEVPLSLLRKGGQGFPVAYMAANVGLNATQGIMTTNSFSCQTNCAQQGNNTPLFNYADTISWTKGKHAFRGGADIRIAYSKGYETPLAPIPKALGGAGLNPNQRFRNNSSAPGMVSNNETVANQLLYFLSGSLNSAQQYYYIETPEQLTHWSSYLDNTRNETWARQNDFSMFLKDDWKVHPSFTLNLGMRYEYYGVPWEGGGLTPSPAGGGIALLGVSGRNLDRWMRTDNPVDLNLLTTMELVGPKTSNPDKSIYKKDRNNLGPAIGFAWQLPWFGAGKTNVRGGYQVSYVKGATLATLVNSIFINQGFLNLAQTQGPTDGSYFDLRDLSSLVPIPPSSLPMQPIPLHKPTQSGNAFDYNYVSPYIQNFTLSVTRDVSRNLSLDVRYIGTRGLKLSGNYDLNSPNVFYNPTLFDALERTRRGEDVTLFDQIFLGLNLNPGVRGCDLANPSALCGPVNGTTQRGSAHLRQNSTFRSDLANGNYEAISNALNIYNGTGSGPAGAVIGVPGERGTVLRRANKGFNVPDGTAISGGPVVPAGLFPENWITANPQLNQANYYTNSGKSTYHSLQVQSTLRPTQGLSLQGTYVWSRALEVSPTGFTNPTEREKDYRLNVNHVTHDFRSFGVFDLPFGPGRQLFSNSSGWIARTIEGWQTSFIVNLSSGQPVSVTAGNMLYDNGVPDVIGPFSMNKGSVQWSGNSGNYFPADRFQKVADPQCGAVASVLGPYCTLQAVTDAKSGQILLQNPHPGNRGTLGQRTMYLPGQWSFDAALSKAIRISESKSLQIRIDGTNIFNHPVANTPSLDINSTSPFGSILDKGDQRREFKGMVRLSF